MLFKYTIEIRNRLVLIILTWVVSVFTAYLYKETLLFLSLQALIHSSPGNQFYFIATDLTEILITYIKLSYFAATQATFWVVIYHILVYLSPGLYKLERVMLKKIVFRSYLLNFVGLVLLNKYILTSCWDFFLSFQSSSAYKTVDLYFEGKIGEYIKLYMQICFIGVLISQSIVWLLVYIDYIDNKVKFVKEYRKLFYMLFLLTATLLTPPDVVSQILVLSSFLVTYELIVMIAIFKTFLVR